MPAPSARIAPALRLRQRGRRRVEHHGNLPGHQIGHHRVGAAIGHVLDVEAARERLELLAAQMKDRAQAGRAVGVFAGIGLHQLDQALHVLRGDRGMHGEHRRRHADLRDRREILHRIVRHLAVEAGIDRVGRDRRDQQRVAVGRATSRPWSAPILPPAPTLFSTKNCWPSSSDSLAAKMRPTMSVGPPAENDTTMRTGRLG